ncbi:hypothetical protein [Thalassospira alkalitolerans]|uniref:hypothetical protein n=1 Tax=Thalassospira alkalitolerans TaxID=1293890 RepID=UPI0030EC3B05|tara:strand:+ start:16266 stop:16733 length:468 start_codon:yes stop_codon:yes gene_type:complete
MLNKTVLMAGTIMMSVAMTAPAYADGQTNPDQTGTMATDDAMKSDAKKMGNKAAEKYDEAKEYTYEQKNEFLAWVEKKSDQLGEKYDEMSAQVNEDSEDAVDELSNAWDGASENLSEAFEDAQDASADTWENVKASTLEAINNAEKALSDDHATE